MPTPYDKQAEEITGPHVDGCETGCVCSLEEVAQALTQAAEEARKAERERCVEVVEKVEVPYEQISDDEGAPDARAYLEAIIAALRQDGGEKAEYGGTKERPCTSNPGPGCSACSGKEGKG